MFDVVPWYRFWNPMSGLGGGVVMGVIISAVVVVLLFLGSVP